MPPIDIEIFPCAGQPCLSRVDIEVDWNTFTCKQFALRDGHAAAIGLTGSSRVYN